MTLDIQWDHQFCLGCDKQTDGETYCSESCRLADYEKMSPSSSTPNSGASSPALAGPLHAWGFPTLAASPNTAVRSNSSDFSATSPTSRRIPQPAHHHQSTCSYMLSPSSSHASLSSMGSSASKSRESYQLSEKARRELQAYASSFEHVRLQRRRSK